MHLQAALQAFLLQLAADGRSPHTIGLVAIGRVKRAVIRSGRRVRFIVRDLLDELRQVQG